MRIAIIGRTEILYETARFLRASGHEIAIIITAKEAPEYKRSASDFKELAEFWGVPFFHDPQIDSVNSEAFELLNDMPKVDIGVSMNYTGVIPQTVINLFPLGILNAHGGDLPRYRGNACQAWAIINGEDKIGLCIHRMIGGELDSGDIVARDYFKIDIKTKVTDVWNWMCKSVPTLMLKAINHLGSDPSFILERQSKDPVHALRCYPRRPEDGHIDWKLSAQEILRLINGCNKPYAGAFCHYENQKLLIWDADLLENDELFCAIPGQVTLIGNDFIEVACASGKLRINKVQIEGGCEVNPNTLITSIRKRLS